MSELSEPYLNRFSGVARLYGEQGLHKLAKAHVAVIGVGGVGSWIVEALVRSGVGSITLMDFDDVCVSNFNRQILATDETVGKFKIDVLAERIRLINKDCQLHLINDRFSPETADNFFSQPYDYIVDAFDNGQGKAFLAHHCRSHKKKLIVLGSVGGKRDPSKIKIDDLCRSTEDTLLAFMRKKLRADYGFPRLKNKKFSIPCVYSTEKYVYPADSTEIKKLDCGGGMGAITHLAGAFGFFAVSRVINDLVGAGT